MIKTQFNRLKMSIIWIQELCFLLKYLFIVMSDLTISQFSRHIKQLQT